MPKADIADAAAQPPSPRRGGRPGAANETYGAFICDTDETATIRLYMPLVKRVAMHLKGRLPDAVQTDDLIQAGLIAVLRSLRSGAIAGGGDAALRRIITNAMIDEARREAWAPVRTLRLAKAAAEAIGAVKQRTGRDGDDGEIAAEMGISVAEYRRILLQVPGIRLLHLDALEESAEQPLQVSGNQESGLQERQVMTGLARAIAELPERERLVMSLYYEQELNMEEVGKVLGLDKSTVCRAHGRALLMLRDALGERSAGRSKSRVAE